jgi:hypothetical protein
VICPGRNWNHGFEANPGRFSGGNSSPLPGNIEGTRKVLIIFLGVFEDPNEPAFVQENFLIIFVLESGSNGISGHSSSRLRLLCLYKDLDSFLYSPVAPHATN